MQFGIGVLHEEAEACKVQSCNSIDWPGVPSIIKRWSAAEEEASKQ